MALFDFVKKILGSYEREKPIVEDTTIGVNTLPEGEEIGEEVKQRPKVRPRCFKGFGSRNPGAVFSDSNVVGYSSWANVAISELLKHVRLAIDTEPIVRMAIDKYVDSITEKGWMLIGRDEAAVNWVKKRLFEISIKAGTTFDEIVRSIVRSIVMYSNAFIILKRSPKDSSGKSYLYLGKERKPIASIYVVSPLEIQAKLNKHGEVEKWRQETSDGKTVEFDANDVIHIYYAQEPGRLLGVPFIRPVLDAIYLKRLLEEMEVDQASNFAYPFTHVKVGNDTYPVQHEPDEEGKTEIDYYDNLFRNEEDKSVFITDHRVEVNMITPSGRITDFTSMIKRYEQEIITGLGLSGVLVGQTDSGNRDTARVQQDQFFDRARAMQNAISVLLTQKLVMPLYWEREGRMTLENVISFAFYEVDEVRLIARENHAANLFNNNIITLTEARERCGMLPMKDVYNTSYYLFPGKNSAAANFVANQDQPENQHGKQTAKPRYKKDEVEGLELFWRPLDNAFKDIHDGVADDCLSLKALESMEELTVEDMRKSFELYITRIGNDIYINKAANDGVRVHGFSSQDIKELTDKYSYLVIDFVNDLYDQIIEGLKDRKSRIDKESFIQMVKDKARSLLKYRISRLYKTLQSDLGGFSD